MTDAGGRLTRRDALGVAADGVVTALGGAAQAQQRTAAQPAARAKGPRVWLDLDQAELDAAYDQTVWASNRDQVIKRYATHSDATRARLGAPRRFAYGATAVEGLDLYATGRAEASIIVFIHGVVAANGDIIGQGHKAVRANHDPAAHAEVVAIRDAWQHVGAWSLLKGSTLYTSCQPCLLCSFVIMQIGARRVVFAARGTDVPGYRPSLGADLAKAAAWVNAQPEWPRIEVVGDFMRDQARDVIAAFPWGRADSRDSVEPS